MFRKYSAFIVCILAFLIIWGCSEDNVLITDTNLDDDPIESEYPDGLSLLGLANSRTFSYMQIDTVTTLDDVYDVNVITSFLNIGFSGSNTDWIIKKNGTPMSNYKVSEFSILQNGYWTKNNDLDSLVYFSVPPMIIPRFIVEDTTWTGYYPPAAGDSTRIFYNSYFGFHFQKRFIGIERLQVPAGEFDTYRFDVDLFENDYSGTPVIKIREYYAPHLGLVQQNISGGPLKRTLSLIDTLSLGE